MTKSDLDCFKSELIEEVKKLMNSQPFGKEILRSADVMELLGISAGSLQTLRITGKLPFKKVNGTLFYKRSDVERMVEAC